MSLFFPLAIQRNITLVAIKYINVRYIVQGSFVAYNVRRCYLKYTKAKLNVAYLDSSACGKILDVLPEAVKNFITGE